MSQEYTLYHHNYSICSIMVRFTLAIRGNPKNIMPEMHFKEQVVDILHEEQLSEKFLLEVNKMGQVPVLTSTSLPEPIADSLEITHYLAQFYPSLIPQKHKVETESLLAELHDLNYFSLSFSGREEVAQGFKAAVLRRLHSGGDISDTYRKALEFKLGILERDKIGGLDPVMTSAMSVRARALMEKFESLLSASGPWVFGLTAPSAVDAHLIPFVARMRDVRREELIPEKLGRYADAGMETAEWKKTMDGRKTMISR